ADALRFMAETPGVYCIHCKEGKDRTGFLCAVLELLMGAGMDEIIADYMETYCNFFGVEKGSERYAYISSIITDELAAVGIGREGNLQKQTADFLKRIGLSSDEVETLKKNLSVL
ncbi:MAG: tyrosine-protein phosphatase, partial [Spirochaetales bacterium]|nr:tyrosine-protein phosphatase [Spirochaetales bacterium]